MKETDKVLKAIAEGLKLMAKAIDSVADQVNSLAAPATKAKTKPPVKKARKAKAPAKPAKKASKKPSRRSAAKGRKKAPATDVVMAVIQNADSPVDNNKISSETGFDAKKVANLVYQLKKKGRIKNVERGMYAPA